MSESEPKHCFSVDLILSSFPIYYARMSHVDRNQLRKLLPLLLQFPIPTRELKTSKHHYHHLEFRRIFSTCKVNRHPVKLNNKAIHATKSTAPDFFFLLNVAQLSAERGSHSGLLPFIRPHSPQSTTRSQHTRLVHIYVIRNVFSFIIAFV